MAIRPLTSKAEACVGINAKGTAVNNVATVIANEDLANEDLANEDLLPLKL
jgi:hypothetical protein